MTYASSSEQHGVGPDADERQQAAALLDEVGRQRKRVLRRVGNGWFEMAIIGAALLVTLAADAVISNGALSMAVSVVCIGAAVLAVRFRMAAANRKFDAGYSLPPAGMWVIWVTIFGLCWAFSAVLHGTVRELMLAVVPSAFVVALAVSVRKAGIIAIAAVTVVGSAFRLVPSVHEWAPSVVFGVGYLAIGAVLFLGIGKAKA